MKTYRTIQAVAGFLRTNGHNPTDCGRFRGMALLCLAILVAPFFQAVDAGAQMVPLRKPAWVGVLPIGDEYVYYRGDGVDTDIERAKTKARADAIRKAQMAATRGITGVAVDNVNVTEEKTQILSASSVEFLAAKIQGLEWMEDHSELVPTRGGGRYHYYCLIRIPKPKAGVFAQLGGGVIGRADAVFRSAVVPGWGQIRQGRRGTGAFYMVSGIGLGLVYGALHVMDNEDIQVDGKKRDWGSYKQTTGHALAGVYAINLIDALIWGKQARNYQVSAAPGRLMMTKRF